MSVTTLQAYNSCTLWLESFRSKETRDSYCSHLTRFCTFSKTTPDELVTKDADTLKRMVLEYVVYLKKVAKQKAGKPNAGDISVNSIPILLNGVKSFLDEHEKTLPWKKIKRYYPSQVSNEYRAYTREEIAKLLELADLRDRCLIYLMASGGLRVGAIPSLKWKHLSTVENGIGMLKVYWESKKDRYVTFLTPECMKELERYKQDRLTMQEKVGPESPLIRDKFAFMSPKTNHPRPVAEITINALIKDMLKRAMLPFEELQPNHSFRKFWNTAMKNSGVDKDAKESMLGHSLGLDDVYYDQEHEESKQKLFNEYLKGVDSLTINEENRLKTKVEELRIKRDELDALKARVESMDQIYEVSKKFSDDYPKLADVDTSLKLLKALSEVAKSGVSPEQLYTWVQPALTKLENTRQKREQHE